MAGLPGGWLGVMLSFEIAGGAHAAQRFAGALQRCFHAVSLGDGSTLYWPWEDSNLVRVSVGIAAVDDLIVAFDQALRAIG